MLASKPGGTSYGSRRSILAFTHDLPMQKLTFSNSLGTGGRISLRELDAKWRE
jgi:hypothetical protein